MKGLFASLEEMGVEIEGASNVEVEVQPVIHADELETALLDVEEAAQEVATIDDNVSAAVDVAESLESMIESLESALARGGMDNTAASMFQHAMEQYHERLGVKYEPVASLESFDGIATKSSATVASLEGAKEFGKKIWDSIVRAIQWSIDMVKKFFKAIFNARGRLEDRGGEIAKRAAQSKNMKPKDTKLKGKYAKALVLKGKIVTADEAAGTVIKALQEVTKFDVNGKLAESLSDMAYDEDGRITGTRDMDSILTDLQRIMTGGGFGEALGADQMKAIGIKSTDRYNYQASGFSLPGNKMVYWYGVFDKKAEGDPLESLKIKSGIGNDIGKDSAVGETVEAAEPGACALIGKRVSEIARLIDSVKNEVEKRENMKKKLKKRIEELSKRYGAEQVPVNEDAGFGEKIKDGNKRRGKTNGIRKALMQVIQTIDQPALSLCQYALQESKALADYAEKSLAIYNGEQVSDKEDDKGAAPAAA